MKKLIHILSFIFLSMELGAQFAPPDGQPGSTAIHMDSSVFVGWVSKVNISRGWQDISDQNLGFTTVGDSSLAAGKADNAVVSLGDGGVATIVLNTPIFDGPSWDFAVFENSFVNNFLELAFVEVSSDGQNFYRFPAASLTQDTLQIGAFDFIDATKINNLAGKYRGTFGTPFDLAQLSHHPALDIQNITHLKIIDVVGSINDQYGSLDTAGNLINDPWPTPFASSGFDLDAIGLIHIKGFYLEENAATISVYPNPAKNWIRVDNTSNGEIGRIRILSMQGIEVYNQVYETSNNPSEVDVSFLESGLYLLEYTTAANSQLLTMSIVE